MKDTRNVPGTWQRPTEVDNTHTPPRVSFEKQKHSFESDKRLGANSISQEVQSVPCLPHGALASLGQGRVDPFRGRPWSPVGDSTCFPHLPGSCPGTSQDTGTPFLCPLSLSVLH